MKTCRYDGTMNIYKFIASACFMGGSLAHVVVTGELSFDIRVLNVDQDKRTLGAVVNVDVMGNNNSEDINDETDIGMKRNADVEVRASEYAVTAPAIVECVYQYPEKEQTEAVLSDMMNQLTKVFVRAQDTIRERSRRGRTRFRVVDKLDSSFFEKAFSNMSKEFRTFYNSTIALHKRAEDPCQNQGQIKELWQKLLEHSQKILERAGIMCVEEFLRARNRADDSSTRLKLDQLAKQELAKTRQILLNKLCDEFQMCYNELLSG